MALLNSIDEVKEYVSVNKNLKWLSVFPYAKQADRKFIRPLVGDAVVDLYPDISATDSDIIKVYDLLREASANLLWFLYLPLANVQISDAGIAVSSGENYKAAEWWQVRDLRRSFVDAGFMAIDEALKIMEANEDKFPSWNTSEGYTLFKELFVNRTETFNRWFGIGNSRKTFLALRPYMLEVHHQHFTSKLNAATLETINALDETADPETYQVLELLQASMVNYTVYKAVNSGSFLMTDSGIYQKLENFVGYKTDMLSEPQIHRIKEERLVAGEEYYKKALTIIEANLDVFVDYEVKETAVFVNPQNTGSLLGI